MEFFLRKKSAMGMCLGLILAAGLAQGCKKEQAAPAAPPPQVSAVQVTPKDVAVEFEYVAQTQSSQQVNIHARVNGFLEKRVYDEGSMVKTGQKLFLMDAKPFQAQLDQAQAALAQQKAANEIARLDLERNKVLAKQKVVSQKDMDDSEGHYQTTLAAVQQAQAAVETAELNLSYTSIASPVDGISGAAQQADGSYIDQTNSLLTTVSVLSPMWVNFSVSENELLRYREQVAKGQLRAPKGGEYEVQVMLNNGNIFPHAGHITFAAPSIDAETGTFMIRTSVENPDGVLRPNQFVHVRLQGAIRPQAILVPQRAIMEGSKGQFVWVVGKDNKAEQRPVTVANWQGEDWFVTEGLTGGEWVVVDGGQTLQAGISVTVKPIGGKQPGAGA